MKRKYIKILIYSFIGCVLLIAFIIGSIIQLENIIIVLNKPDQEFMDYIPEHSYSHSNSVESSDSVNTPKMAVKLAKDYLKTNDIGYFRFSPYRVYYDMENHEWQITARGILVGSSYFIIDARSGMILEFVGTKF